MAVEKQIFSALPEFEQISLKDAPSIDIPHLVTKAVFKPKSGGSYMLFYSEVDSNYRPAAGCPYCNSNKLRLNGKASKARVVHDVIRNNWRVDIAFYPPRMLCQECKQIFTADIEGISKGRQMTVRLEEYLRKQCFLEPFGILSMRSGLSTATIENIFDEEVDKYEKKREENPPMAPRVLGIDEKHLGNLMRGTLVDVERGTLLDLLPDNRKRTMIEAIKALKDWDKNIQVVTTDMSNSYISWLPDLLPNATIVVDKYHVIQDIERKISSSRKPIINSISRRLDQIGDLQERARQQAVLRYAKNNPRLFNFSMDKLARQSSDDKLNKRGTVLKEFPEFRLLHNLYHTIEHMYKQTSREAADHTWKKWVNALPPGGSRQYESWCKKKGFDKECFEDFRSFSRDGFQQFAPYILNYFNSADTRFTNAMTESLNNTIGRINIAGSGYSFKRLRGKALFAPLVNEQTIYGITTKMVDQIARSMSESDTASFKWISPLDQEQTVAYLFTEKRVPVSIPELNIYEDCSWLYTSLSSEFMPASERTRIQEEAAKREIGGPYGAPVNEDNITQILSLQKVYEALPKI